MNTTFITPGGITRTRGELASIPTPLRTPTWTPVPHYDVVESMVDALTSAGIEVWHESYCTSGRGDARLFRVLHLAIPDVSEHDFSMALGISASNDKSLAIQAVAGARVYVCTNLVIAGDSGVIVLRRKHTSRLDLTEVVL
jgi:hypothetical protein